MPTKRKPTDKVQLKIRLPDHTRVELEKAARRHAISLNQEINDRLTRSFKVEVDDLSRAIIEEQLKGMALRQEKTEAMLYMVLKALEGRK